MELEDLRPAGKQPPVQQVICPCLWTASTTGVRRLAIPRYNNENRWYIEKYQNTSERSSDRMSRRSVRTVSREVRVVRQCFCFTVSTALSAVYPAVV